MKPIIYTFMIVFAPAQGDGVQLAICHRPYTQTATLRELRHLLICIAATLQGMKCIRKSSRIAILLLQVTIEGM
ncbi:hypothetical protein M405DRAFT_362600 [Rhizopogon salebrosus TDB-379]|nr:hypothetical protein M405DRAFT_362600 [Rhizopogon salebrosus TDB-379]